MESLIFNMQTVALLKDYNDKKKSYYIVNFFMK